MVSITSWTRLEPRCRDATLQDGLEARLHDPLWMLARQWQLGEFAGHDGGTVVEARIRIACAPLSRYRPGTGDAEAQPYDPRTHPLEVLVEGAAPDETEHEPVDLRAAAEAGLHFARILRQHDVADYIAAFREHYAIEPPGGDEAHPLSTDATRFLTVVASRAIDGARLHRDLAQVARGADGALTGLPAEPPIADDDHDTVATAAGRWLDWYEQTYGTHQTERSAWIPERMTHQFATSAVTDHGETVLEATEHPGGRLDWYAFDHVPDVTLRGASDGDDKPREIVTTVLPSRVRYRGMPTSSWWELEDGRADLGAIATSPEDLARLLYIELAITYGNDWFLIPADIEVGSLCEVRSLVVTDTFGQRTLIRHYADVDGPDGSWRMFDLAAAPDHPASRMTLLPPALPASHRGPAVEEVLLRRDELANLAWAIERTVPSALGTPVDRRDLASVGPADQPDEPSAPYAYRLATDVPDHWFPLVPVPGPSPGSIRLVRGRMHSRDDEPQGNARGTVLRPGQPLVLHDEHVPRAGLRVTRHDERGRWSDGSTHTWRTHRRRAGGGEAWSGLRHDIVEATDNNQERP